MTKHRLQSGKQNFSTDDLISDYLNDVWGSAGVCPQNNRGLVEEFIEVDESTLVTAQEFPKSVRLGDTHEASLGNASYDCPSSDDEDEIVVAEYDLLPQERKGAVEKFCINRLGVRPSSNRQVLLTPGHLHVSNHSVKDGYFLIPIIDFNNVSSKTGYRSQEEAHLLLLNSLYFLRRPLPSKVRENFLNYGEQAIDDFNAAKWLAKFQSEAMENE